MRTHKLKSGRTLRVQAASFRKSKSLFDEISKEIKSLDFDPKAEFDINFVKNIVLGLVSSDKVEAAIWPCMDSCLYENNKITVDTFDKPDDMTAREDFLEICQEVVKENVLPFTKNLSSKLEPILKDLGLSL